MPKVVAEFSGSIMTEGDGALVSVVELMTAKPVVDKEAKDKKAAKVKKAAKEVRADKKADELKAAAE